MIQTFISLATSPDTVKSAASVSGMSVKDLTEGLAVAAVGTTNAVNVSVMGDNPAYAETAVGEVTRVALAGYAKFSLHRLQAALNSFHTSYAAATTELNNYLNSAGEAAPDTHYNAVQQQLINVNAGVSTGNATALRAELATLQPIVLRFRELLAAQSRLGDIQRAGQERALELQAVADSTVMLQGASAVHTEEVPRVAAVLRFTLFGALSVALVTAAALYLLNFGLGVRRARNDHAIPPSPTDLQDS
jgi:hypothetical protein